MRLLRVAFVFRKITTFVLTLLLLLWRCKPRCSSKDASPSPTGSSTCEQHTSPSPLEPPTPAVAAAVLAVPPFLLPLERSSYHSLCALHPLRAHRGGYGSVRADAHVWPATVETRTTHTTHKPYTYPGPHCGRRRAGAPLLRRQLLLLLQTGRGGAAAAASTAARAARSQGVGARVQIG